MHVESAPASVRNRHTATSCTFLSSHVTSCVFSWSPFFKQHLVLLVFIFSACGNLCTHLSGVKQLEICELWEQSAVCQGEICLSTAHGCTMVWVSLKWTRGIRANQKLITPFWLLNHAWEKWQTVWFNAWKDLNTNMALYIYIYIYIHTHTHTWIASLDIPWSALKNASGTECWTSHSRILLV